MPDDHGERTRQRGALFGEVFDRGGADTSDLAWLQAMLDAEAGLARALERARLAPAGAGAKVTSAAKAGNFDIAELGELSALTGNPVPGLARVLTRAVAATDRQAAQAVHKGATSQDIVDTAAMLLARRALDVAAADLRTAASAAARLAEAHRGSVMIGRTLLQQAVPVSFGGVAASWLAGLDSALEGLRTARETRLAVQFGGAAGTLASLGEEGTRVARFLAQELDLPLPALPWHTERLRIIDIATAMARVTAALSRIARDVTLLAQSEVAEVSEGPAPEPESGNDQPDAPRRGGSSAMPNKNNPVAAIAVLGCAKQVPGLLATLVASAEQEHQRAAGAWHAEWEPFGGILRLAGTAAAWGAELLAGLRVDPARMERNLAAAGGLPLAERVTALLAETTGRPRAHDLVAAAAAKSVASGVPLRDVLLAAPELEDHNISPERIDLALDPSRYLGSTEAFISGALRDHQRRREHEGERPHG
ncbi:MAG TPA: adenylosuccinate lyase family protein [Trebonia sp.]|jgi:3-carboxy-cis,cis-muconate cycloisomerase|nr:adenylosuccinate lyase family protein [Trebonia sp.]